MTSLVKASMRARHSGLADDESAKGSFCVELGIGGKLRAALLGRIGSVDVDGTGVVPPTPRGFRLDARD